MAKFNSAGADASHDYADQFRQIVANDPDIQRAISGVWGSTPVDQRPSDTPKHLEKANDAASKQISQILKNKGIALPDRTFINPRTGALEGHRGWSGLSGLQKAAIIAAAGATGIGGAAALGAFGGGAAAGAGAAGAGTGGAGAMGGLGVTSGLTALPGATVGMGPIGGSMGWGSLISGLGKTAAKQFGGDLVQQLLSGDSLHAAGQGLGALAGTQAHNRGVKLDAMMAGDEMQLAADRERRAAEGDILKNMQIAEYLKGGGYQDTGPTMSSSGRPLPRFDFGTRPATEAEMDMAGTLQGQLKNRLENPRQLRNYEDSMDPGAGETAMNWLSPILSTIGIARGGGRSLTPQIPGLSRTQEFRDENGNMQDDRDEPFTPTIPNAGGGNPWSKVNFRNRDNA